MTLFSRTKIEDQTDSETKSPELTGTSQRADQPRPVSVPTTDATVVQLRMLGLSPGATWEDITEAHARLVSDLTPGPNASHRNVSLAEQFLSEVNQAFASLRMQSVA